MAKGQDSQKSAKKKPPHPATNPAQSPGNRRPGGRDRRTGPDTGWPPVADGRNAGAGDVKGDGTKAAAKASSDRGRTAAIRRRRLRILPGMRRGNRPGPFGVRSNRVALY